MNKYLKILIFFIFFFLAFLISPEFKYTRVCADQNNPFSCENKWKIEYQKVRFTGGADIIKFTATGKPINEDYVPVTPITLVFSTAVAFGLTFATVNLIGKKAKKHKSKDSKEKE
jgi:hypothetical protein